jgi:hypothetical protein
MQLLRCMANAAGPTIRAGSDPAGDSAVNFCVRSRAAVSMALCLLRTGGQKGGYMEIALDPAVNRTGRPGARPLPDASCEKC